MPPEQVVGSSGVVKFEQLWHRAREQAAEDRAQTLARALSLWRGEPLTLYGDGSQTRSFCYVDDQIDGQVALLDSSYVGPVNIGNPDEYTVAQLAQLVIEITGSHSTIEHRPLPQDD
ncbi:NAD-dependent epimerase/dehydratase family protein, partial [Lacticaseibacillus rhamnosus]